MSSIAFRMLAFLVVAAILLGCASPAVAPTKPPAETSAPRPGESPAAATKPSAPPASPGAEGKPATAAAPAAPQPSPTQPKIKRGGTIRTALLSTYDTMDTKLSSLGTSPMTAMMFESLLRLEIVDPVGKFEPKPELAESWNLADPQTLVLKLRKGVKFHDGSTLDAEAIKYNIERMIGHPKSTSKLMGDEIASVEVIDPSTVKLNLKQPSAVILAKQTLAWGGTGSAGTAIMSKAAYDKWGDDAGLHPAGTGPMQLDEWRRDDRVVLKRFEGYWKMGADGKPLPYADRMEERFMPDPAVSLLEMKAGNMELIEEIEGKDIAAIKATPALVYKELPWGGNYYFTVALNPNTGPFANNLKLRQAMFYAIDRESMAKVLTFGVGFPLHYMFWTKGQLGYDESLPKYGYDVQKAKQLLSEAGYPNGLDITLDHISRAEDSRVAQVAKDMWDKVGIRTTISAMERLAFVDKTRKACNFEANFGRMGSSVDPDGHSRLVVTNGSGNYSCANIPEIDKCMAEGRSTYEPEKRHEIYKRCITLMYENAIQTTGYTRPYNWVHAKYLMGIRPQWTLPDLKEAWLDK